MTVRSLWLLAWVVVLAGTRVLAGGTPVVLAPKAEVGATDRVTVAIDMGGKLKARRVTEGQKADTQQFTETPLKVVGEIEYMQRRLAPTGDVEMRQLRHYSKTDVAITTGATRTKPTLAETRSLVVCDHASTGVRLWCPTASLGATEFDLIDLPGNTLVLDQLMPADAVAPKATWEHSTGDMMALLGLRAASECKASSILTESNERYARAELKATLTGQVDGTSTKLEVQGIYVIGHTLGRVTQINLAIKELREIGPVTPGLDGVAKLQIKVEPNAVCNQLDDAAVAKLPGEPSPELLQVVTVMPGLGVEVQHDRAWYVTAKGSQSVTLRKIDEVGLVANCTVARPKSGVLDPHTAIENFRKDVETTLGKDFQSFAADTQWITPQGYRTIGLVARGATAGVPVEWRSFLLADDKGERVSLSFTLELAVVSRLGNADRELVDTVKIVPRTSVASVPAPIQGAPAKQQRRRR